MLAAPRSKPAARATLWAVGDVVVARGLVDSDEKGTADGQFAVFMLPCSCLRPELLGAIFA